MKEINSWYLQNIEKKIRPLVKLLRDNGFNTYQSCGHKMYVLAYWNNGLDEARLYNLLVNNGHNKFEINIHWHKYNNMVCRYVEVKLLKIRNFTISNGYVT